MRELPTEEILDFYRAQRAGGSDYVGYSEPTLKRAALRTVEPLATHDVVELGAGPNPVVPFALAAAGRSVTVVEISSDFCETARTNAERRGLDVTVVCAPAHASGLESESFDLALLTEVLEHIPDELLEPTLREIRRLLRPGGWFFVSVPNEFGLFARYRRWRSGPIEWEQHLREFDHGALRDLLRRCGFDVERSVIVRATEEPPWRSRVAWLIDRVTFRPEWSLKVAFLARAA